MWTWRRGVLMISAVAALTRLALILLTPHFALFGDPSDYERHALSIATGHGYPPSTLATPGTPSAFRPPAYPYTLAALYAIVGGHPEAGRVLGAALGVLAAILLALLGRAVWGERTGLLAGSIAAVFPSLIGLNGSLLSEALFVPVELAFGLALVSLARRPGSVRAALAAGGLAALALLTRSVALPWVLIALGVIARRESAPTPMPRWRSAAAVLLAAAVVLAPWTIRNLEALHGLVPVSTEGGFTLAGQYNAQAGAAGSFEAVWRLPLRVPQIAAQLAPLYRRAGGVNEAGLDSALRGAASRYLADHPGHLATASALDALRLLDLGTAHGFVSGLAYRQMALPPWLQAVTTRASQALWLLAGVLVAARLAARRGPRLGSWWLWAIPTLTFLLTVPMVGTPLKRVPLDPFAILVLAAGAAAALSARGRSVRRGERRPAEPPGAVNRRTGRDDPAESLR